MPAHSTSHNMVGMQCVSVWFLKRGNLRLSQRCCWGCNLPMCDVVSLGEGFLTFRIILLSDWVIPECDDATILRNVGITRLKTQCHISGELRIKGLQDVTLFFGCFKGWFFHTSWPWSWRNYDPLKGEELLAETHSLTSLKTGIIIISSRSSTAVTIWYRKTQWSHLWRNVASNCGTNPWFRLKLHETDTP
jgi:hypothetical protein